MQFRLHNRLGVLLSEHLFKHRPRKDNYEIKPPHHQVAGARRAGNLQPSTLAAFTYQGQLNANGGTANGLYDLRFQVWGALTNGNLIAGPLTNSATGVTNGLFTVTLDFGPGVFTGRSRPGVFTGG